MSTFVADTSPYRAADGRPSIGICRPTAAALAPRVRQWLALHFALVEIDAGAQFVPGTLGGCLCESDRIAAIRARDPLMPVAGVLDDAERCERFAAQVLVFDLWRQLRDADPTAAGLQRLYARCKYLVMSRHLPSYRVLGRLLADTGDEPLEQLALRVVGTILDVLARPATRQGNANALEHIRGYLKRDLDSEEKRALGAAIARYREGAVPLSEPLALLQTFFRDHPDAYIAQQLFMQLPAFDD